MSGLCPVFDVHKQTETESRQNVILTYIAMSDREAIISHKLQLS